MKMNHKPTNSLNQQQNHIGVIHKVLHERHCNISATLHVSANNLNQREAKKKSN